MGTILRAAFFYWVLLFVLRLIGRRASDHMTPFEMILIFLFGGMSIQAVVADDRSATNALLGIVTIGLMHVLVAWLKTRSSTFGKIVDGTPIVVVEDGHWHRDRMKRLRLHSEDVMSVAREKGLTSLDRIRYAIIERNGSISIVAADGD
jgi:uncharacterized membrane protein YcaP (DUF421 family)